jgi:hypothetical protein
MDPTILLYNPNADANAIYAATSNQSYSAMATLIWPIVGFFILIILFMCLGSLCKPSKTKAYREVVTDMYVAGTIRKYADEDKINLDDEYKKYTRWQRKRDLKDKELDSAVEANLKDKVSEKVDKEISALK